MVSVVLVELCVNALSAPWAGFRHKNGGCVSKELFSPVIETERLTIRALMADDAESLLEIFSDPNKSGHPSI